MSILKTTMGLVLAVVLAACGGGGGDAKTPVTTPTPTVSAAISSLLISAPSPQTLNADGTSSITLTVRALDASNALVKGAALALATSGNAILGASSLTTDVTTGLATVTLTANSSDQTTRVATVSATCASCAAAAASLPIQINGATLTVSSSAGTTLTAGGNTVTLTALVKNASGVVLAGVPVTFVATDATVLGVSTATGTTNSSGVVTTTVSGLAASTSATPVTVTALGNANSLSFTVNAAVGALTVTTVPANDFTMVTNVTKQVVVSAPGATSLTFASTLGTFTTSSPVAGSSVTNLLTVTQAGTATVDVTDSLGRKASIKFTVSPPWQSANKLIFSANQTTVGLATSTTTPTVHLTARALYSVGSSDQAVANVPILFTMLGGPGAGEYLTPAYQLTDSAGYASADFYAGTSASIPNGIVVSAATQGTTGRVSTGDGVTGSTNPNDGGSSLPVKLTVGGQALSVAFGSASVLRESTDHTLYIQDYSVQVTDANNNPVPNAIVTLRVRPVAFSLGSGCTIDLDRNVPTQRATYCSEDANANGSLEATAEDGKRILTTVTTAGQCGTGSPTVYVGTSDGALTPQNSVAGSVPSTVTTDASGTAPFSLTYLKASAIWVVDKISATVSVAGTESGTSTIFQLPVTTADVTLPGTCHIPDSPFSY